MASYLDGSLLKQPVGQWLRFYGLDDPQKFIEDLEWVTRTMRNAVFKRIQFPPIVMVSRGAFGSDYREAQQRPQTSERYQQLRREILQRKGDHEHFAAVEEERGSGGHS